MSTSNSPYSFSIFARFTSTVDVLCQPNPKYTPTETEQEISAKRSKVAFYVHFCTFFLFSLDHFINGTPIMDCVYRSLLCFVLVISNLLSCRYHPEIFRITHGIACMIIGPGAMSSSQSIYIGLALAPLIAPGHFLFTGSLNHGLLQAFIQLVFLNTIYYSRMKESFIDLTPDQAVFAMKSALTVSFLIQLLIFILAHVFVKQAYKKISAMEKADLESQKTLLLSFSHELRNFINSLLGNVKLISLEPNISERVKKLLRNADVCGELLLHLVNNILDTGKVEVGELEINMKPIKIHETLEKVWSVCSELIKEKGLTGSMRIPKNLPQKLVLDHYRLTQVFLNLVGNAIKFTEKGSININIEWLSDQAKVGDTSFEPLPFNQDDDEQDEGIFDKSQSLRRLKDEDLIMTLQDKSLSNKAIRRDSIESDKGVLKVNVIDTGCGMDRSQMQQLFRKFSQVSNDSSRRMLGTGLGLFISKQICRRMNGDIRVYSKKNVGSCFSFCLSVDIVKDRISTSMNSTSFIRDVGPRQLKAMVVDDAIFNHTILETFLKKFGITVTTFAVNGIEAYEKYSRLCNEGKQPDIVTMDIEMPLMNGKDCSQMIREFEKRKGLPPCFLVMVSGNCSGSVIEECTNRQGRIQADDFLKKPVRMDELSRSLGSRFVQNV